jgi:hypothetical protein
MLAGMSWLEHLPWVLLGQCAAPKEISGVSSAEVMYRQQLVLFGELPAAETAATCFLEERQSNFPQVMCLHRTYATVAIQTPAASLAQAQYIYVRSSRVSSPLVSNYTGP